MGCGGSKDVDEKEARKIDSEFAKLNIPKFDEFFEKASGILEKAENIRAGLQDAREDAAEYSGAWQLKEYKYNDAIQTMFWAMSANAGGDIKKAKVEFLTEPPFIHLNYFEGLQLSTRYLTDAFEAFLKAVTAAPVDVPKMVIELTEMLKQGEELVKTGKDEAKNAGLGFSDSAKAVMNLGKNMNKLKSEFPKVQNLKPLGEQGLADLKALQPELKKYYDTCDEIGKQAHADVLRSPPEIFDKFNKAPRKTKEDIEKEKKAAEEAKHKREQKKKGKKEAPKKEGEHHHKEGEHHHKEGEHKKEGEHHAGEKK